MTGAGIISRYMAGRFLRTWALILAGFVVLYTAIDFMENISSFMSAELDAGRILLFFAAQLPKVVGLMNPVAALVATLLVLTLMARNSEIVAFKAGGVSLLRLSRPLLAAGLGLSLVSFGLAEGLAPPATATANKIREEARGRRPSPVVRDLWIKGVRMVEHLESYNEADGEARGLTIFFTGEEEAATRRLSAGRGRFADGRLELEEVLDKTYGPGRAFTLAFPDRLTLEDWPAPPPGLNRAAQASEEMSFLELRRVIRRLSAEGFGPVRQRVDLQMKFSFSLLPLVMVLVGLPLGFWREKGGSVALGICLGLAGSFIYLIAMELARNLGYAGLLPPFLAAWLPNAVFTLFGAWLFSFVRQ
ncbi:MAG: LPS export ABC transporter permease LptG [Candidatus Adiutrix sp.]|jgi:lipopolysaccharide export system permease protein|nr:LPS export ABC transporter permease LptG [Candidatus Adiutrix sp.]